MKLFCLILGFALGILGGFLYFSPAKIEKVVKYLNVKYDHHGAYITHPKSMSHSVVVQDVKPGLKFFLIEGKRIVIHSFTGSVYGTIIVKEVKAGGTVWKDQHGCIWASSRSVKVGESFEEVLLRWGIFEDFDNLPQPPVYFREKGNVFFTFGINGASKLNKEKGD